MKNIFEIKEEYKAVIVGYNGSGLPLGARNDLHLLAELAQHNPGFRKYFVQMPTPEQLVAYKTGKFLAETETKEPVAPGQESAAPVTAIIPVIPQPEEME